MKTPRKQRPGVHPEPQPDVQRVREPEPVVAIQPVAKIASVDRWAFPATLALILALSACHTYYLVESRLPPSTDEAHYMTGALSISEGLRSGSLTGIWAGYQNALGFKPPLICIPAGILMWLFGGVTLPAYLSLVPLFAVVGLSSYSLFRRCLQPYYAAVATILLLTTPMITGLTHNFLVELLLVLICVTFLGVLTRDPWSSLKSSGLAGVLIGCGILCKPTFAVLVFAPLVYSFGVAASQHKDRRALLGLFRNLLAAGCIAVLVAWSWYSKNWEAAVDHAKSSMNCCAYQNWIQADISTGPWIVVFLVSVAGFGLVMRQLLQRRARGSEIFAWILILLLGITTAIACAASQPKGTRYSATWLPMIAGLASAAFACLDSRKWARPAAATLAAASIFVSLQISFGILPIADIRIGDIRVFGSRFPLDIPDWYNNTHPLDRRDFRMAEAEAVIARDAVAHLAPGQGALATTTALGILIDFDYFQLLASARRSPVHYLPWQDNKTTGPEAPDYVLCFTGFEAIYPGVFFINYHPSFRDDVASGKIPYRLLSRLSGPSGTDIWIYAKQRREAHGPPKDGDLLLEAELFHRGDVTADFDTYGRGIGVIVTPKPPGFVEYASWINPFTIRSGSTASPK